MTSHVAPQGKITGLTPNAVTVLEKRYLRRDMEGKVLELPADMFRRVAETIAGADPVFNPPADTKALADAFYGMMTRLEFLPNSPTLMNAGRELGQLSACFVLPVGDSMEEIFDAVKHTALIHKSGGGTGFSFSRLRPANDVVMSTTGISSGPISFMRVFDIATETIKQGGTRRGANMGILRVDHPDIMDFIICKADQKHLNNFNISVGLTEAFMEAVERGRAITTSSIPAARQVVGTAQRPEGLRPHRHAGLGERRTGDRLPRPAQPGQPDPAGRRDRIDQPLRRAAAPALRVLQPGLDQPGEDGQGRRRGLGSGSREVVSLAVHFLDNVIEVNNYPLPQIDEMTTGQPEDRPRRHGVGGHADPARDPLQLPGGDHPRREGDEVHQ